MTEDNTGTQQPPRIEAPDVGEPAESVYADRLRQAEMLLAERQLLPAASVIQALDVNRLTTGERARVLALELELKYLQGESAEALALFRREAPLLEGIDPVSQRSLDEWQLRLVRAEEGPLATAQLSAQFLQMTEDAQQATELAGAVWHNLQQVQVGQLQAQLELEAESAWRGWLELALLAADVMESPEVQSAQIALWQERYPLHPASVELPGGLATLAVSAANTPGRIALLLPLSRGPSEQGRAALEGFLAAQYLARQRGWPSQQLMIMDSADYTALTDAYDSAVRAGADILIGPLTPDLAQGWQPDRDSSVPLLALTPIPSAMPPLQQPEQLQQPQQIQQPPVQFSLTPEDEARQLARLAFAGGARNALVVRPDGDWGDRVSGALIETWLQLEGEVRNIAVYSGQSDYSSSLKAALQLADSEARATRMRRLLAEPMEFNPRRRADLDVIFMLAREAQQARSLKPLFAFHYAGDLPVYATSHIFSGRRDPQRDRDLNGVQLVQMPFSLDPTAPLVAQLEAGGADGEQSDMHALGADAFLLNWRLDQLRATSGAIIRGRSGLLSMDEYGRVHRELTPAVIREGVPTPR